MHYLGLLMPTRKWPQVEPPAFKIRKVLQHTARVLKPTMVQCNTVIYNTIPCNTIRYNAIPCSILVPYDAMR